MYDEVYITKCGLYAHGSLFTRGVSTAAEVSRNKKDTQANLGCTIRLTKFRLQNVVSTLMDHGSCSDTTEYSFYYRGSLFALLRLLSTLKSDEASRN